MASINGVEIKNLKRLTNAYGDGYYTGTIYLNGRKLGFWSQDPKGEGSDTFDFQKTPLNEAFYRWKSYLKDTQYYRFLEISQFMLDVLYYTLTERFYKSEVKKGYKYFYVIHALGTLEGFSQAQLKYAKPYDIEEKFKNNMEKVYSNRSYFKYDSRIYQDLSDFKLVFGTDEGLQEELDKLNEQRKCVEQRNIPSVEQYNDRIKKYHMEKRLKVVEIIGVRLKVQDLINNNFTLIPVTSFEDVVRVISELYPIK